MSRNLILAGGWAHPVDQTALPLAAALAASGLRSMVTDSLDAAAVVLETSNVELLTVHACQFQMLDSRYSAEQRDTFARTTPPRWRAGVEAHISAGRPILALHTAPICFDDWPRWGDIIGGRWNWQRSYHPPPGQFTVRPTDGIEFEVVDELYCNLDVDTAVHVRATATDEDGVTQPLAWTFDGGGTRVAYCALGHDQRGLSNPGCRQLLGQLVDWLMVV